MCVFIWKWDVEKSLPFTHNGSSIVHEAARHHTISTKNSVHLKRYFENAEYVYSVWIYRNRFSFRIAATAKTEAEFVCFGFVCKRNGENREIISHKMLQKMYIVYVGDKISNQYIHSHRTHAHKMNGTRSFCDGRLGT